MKKNKTKEDFAKDFAEMGLAVPPVHKYYDPETYGRNLMRLLPQETGVSYDTRPHYDETACGYIASQNPVEKFV